jgi:FKBP-type peptidyl-prolyl cis-trans isomerase 2
MTIDDGDTVRVHYTGTLEDGTEFDSTEDRGPLEFVVGEGQVIPGFESMVRGLEEGDTETRKLEPEQAYGERDERRTIEVDRSEIPGDVELEVGLQLEVEQPDGGRARVSVSEIGEDTVTLDGNHPLAGRELTFEIEVVDVEGA